MHASTRQSLPSVEQLLRDLVAIPSVNPGSDGPLTAPYGERGMVRYLAELLKPWADSVEIKEVLPGRPNLLAHFRGQRSDLSFAFESHTDTVDVAGMTVAPFTPEVRNGKLFGRGACDDKGPMVAQLLALLRHLDEGHILPCDWWFLATCDEELGGKGAAHLVHDGFRCDGIIVGEPTENQPLIAHKGAVRFTLRIDGLAAHSAYPEQGVNAIQAAADWITRLEASVAAVDPGQTDADARLTFSAGTIQGGDQVNRIPDHVEIQTDWRVPSGFDRKHIESLLQTTAKAVESARHGSRCQWIKTQDYPPFAFDRSGPFATALAPLFGPTATPQTARYATNAGFYAEAGIPALVFGPGSIDQAHRADEWIGLSQIELAIAKLRAIIEGI
jgi:succinyl-diaminopimelate desuccinylase